MSAFQALLIGLVQGLTEFFPISSSAHLKLAKILLHIEESGGHVIFDLACHLGTLLAVLYFLRLEIKEILLKDRKKLALLVLATLPLIPFYFLLKPLRDWASNPHFLGLFLIFTAFILFAGQRFRFRQTRPLSFKDNIKDVLWIGTMQSVALIPGISRSASTISCAHVLGWQASDAVRFSFLLSIPTVIGGNCLELLKIALSSSTPVAFSTSSCIIGFIASGTMGFFMVGYAVRFLEKGNLKPFAWYCLGLGILATIYLRLIHG